MATEVKEAQQRTARVVPTGYTKLEAGTLRRIRVNRDWIVFGEGKPFIVSSQRGHGFVDEFFSDVIFVDGIVYLKSAEESIIGFMACTTRSAWVETSDELFVRS